MPDKCNRGDAANWPARTLSRVVFPEPEGPIIANNLPGFASPLTFFSKNLTYSFNIEYSHYQQIKTEDQKLSHMTVVVSYFQLVCYAALATHHCI